VQNLAAKLILNRGRMDSASQALKDLHWLPIKSRIIHKVLTLVYKCVVEKSAPDYLIKKFKLASQCERSMRSNDVLYRLHVPRTKRKTFADRAISVAGPELWNKLPNDIKQSINTGIFKKKLKTYLFRGTHNLF
jgi:hypothetical protein